MVGDYFKALRLCAFVVSAWAAVACPFLASAQTGQRTMHSLPGGYSTIVASGAAENVDGADVVKQVLIKFTGDLTLDPQGRVLGDVNGISLVGYAFANDVPFKPFANAAIEDGKLVLELQEGRNPFLMATKRLDAPDNMQATERGKHKATIESPRNGEKFVQQVGKAHIIVSFGYSGFSATVAGDHRNYTLANQTKRAVSIAVVRDKDGKFLDTEDLTGDRVSFDSEGRVKEGIIEGQQKK